MKYFGKTTLNPFEYKGSGTYWKSHLKKHGNDVFTEIILVSRDKNECKEFAIKFSLENNIVESSEWANLKIEELDGGGDGSHLHTPEINTKRILANTRKETN